MQRSGKLLTLLWLKVWEATIGSIDYKTDSANSSVSVPDCGTPNWYYTGSFGANYRPGPVPGDTYSSRPIENGQKTARGSWLRLKGRTWRCWLYSKWRETHLNQIATNRKEWRTENGINSELFQCLNYWHQNYWVCCLTLVKGSRK